MDQFRIDTRELDSAGINEVAVVASRAFYTDPFFTFLSGRSITRSRGLTLFFRGNLRHWKTGRIVTVRDTDDRIVGAAAWLPTGTYPQPILTQLAQIPGTVRALYRRPRSLLHGNTFINAIAKNHPKELEQLSTLADKAHEEASVPKTSAGVWGPGKKRSRDSVEGVAAEGAQRS